MKTFSLSTAMRLTHFARGTLRRGQRGVVLFIALIALVVLSLASVALIRSVDTGTIIVGNLAFRQAATTSGDAGIAAAFVTLDAMSNSEVIDPATGFTGLPTKFAGHVLNNTNASAGYYSNADPNLSLSAEATWNTGSVLVTPDPDSSGNSVRYLIQRMCVTADQLLSEDNCTLWDKDTDTGSKRAKDSTEAGLARPIPPPLYRVTVRITGPRNTLSYIQAFVF